MSVELHIVSITQDRRTKAQLESARALEQERLDQAIERRWRERVKANISRRLDRKVEKFITSTT